MRLLEANLETLKREKDQLASLNEPISHRQPLLYLIDVLLQPVALTTTADSFYSFGSIMLCASSTP
jgi:hypothetical protein